MNNVPLVLYIPCTRCSYPLLQPWHEHLSFCVCLCQIASQTYAISHNAASHYSWRPSSYAKNGGSPLVIHPFDGPLLFPDRNVRWSDKVDDARILEFKEKVVKTTSDYARANGVYSRYIYFDYVSQFQDALGIYGSTNRADLIRIARKYDPTGEFQTLVPGRYKLNRGP